MADQILKPRQTVLVVLALILLLAAYLRLGAVNQTVVIHPGRADAGQYFSYAFNLRYWGVYSIARPAVHSRPRPDAYRSPGYPLFLAAFMGDIPAKLMVLRVTLVQAFLGLATVLLAFALFRYIVPPVWALAGALLVALSPHLVAMSTYMLSETLYTFLCVLAMWLAARAIVTKSLWIGSAAGAALAAAALTRPTLEFFILPFLFVWFLSTRGRLRTHLVPAVLIGFVLVFSPWLIRNQISTGRLSSPGMAIKTLQGGMYPNLMYHGIKASYGIPYRFDPRSPEIQSSMGAVLHAIASRFVREPWRELRWYLWGKPRMLFSWGVLGGPTVGDVFVYPTRASPYFTSRFFQATHTIMWGLRWPLVILCLIGCALVWRQPHSDEATTPETTIIRRLLATLVLYYVVLHIVAAPYPRYSIPLLPFIFGLAMMTLLMGARSVKRVYRRLGHGPRTG